jgi:tRNA(Glu) U13 pseudouridine synthase TruD
MTRPSGEPGRIEQGVLAAGAHDHEDFTRPGPLQWHGGRRPLRVPLADLELARGEDQAGEFLELRFALPPGSYATAVRREVLRPGSPT